MTAQQETVLRLSREFGAPRERVFEAWTNPEVLQQWWAASPTMEGALAELDLREGGRDSLARCRTSRPSSGSRSS
jgi:uncharacterized protein YndB with AHSA1/START domain